ncbi:MAG: 5,10-methylenetetrahydrofolate reductase [Acidimicrobiales bacterium]|nr:MAG: 5,10-methylenetetrahydrofolate reductase [Actinomycetota bacterium]MBV6507970.1 5,10-methylenetetrahydrofolate reductase [Acidimicrobiales bacterium]RIK06942.1 MAG: 5,10-methylenetetrahydrofolate reductase [Acidobacteriota bacterium]
MAKISDMLTAGRTFSFEFFPPRSDEAERQLEKALHELTPLQPDYVSVTYGAGGSTKERTRDIVIEICRDRAFPAMAHLTCMGHTRAELLELLADYAANGVHNILALAGDPPADGSAPTGDFTYATELIELIREVGDFCVGVAAHPELHPRSPSRESDRRYLAAKLELADFGISQFFFDNRDYFSMLDELASLGCETPVLPGVMPVVNPTSIARFADMNKAKRTSELWDRFEVLADQPAALMDLAVEVAAEQCRELLDAGAPGVHLYTLNRSEAALRIFDRLDLLPPRGR